MLPALQAAYQADLAVLDGGLKGVASVRVPDLAALPDLRVPAEYVFADQAWCVTCSYDKAGRALQWRCAASSCLKHVFERCMNRNCHCACTSTGLTCWLVKRSHAERLSPGSSA